MKYFTPDLWSKGGSPDLHEREAAHTEWAKNAKEYSLIFDKIKKRLPKKFLKAYYDNKGFHDFDLKNTSIEQSSFNKKIHNPVSINIDLISPDTDAIIRITYSYPELFKINYENSNNNLGFDDYGYSEFLPVDKRTLSHEILFASGATMLVHFKDKNICVEELQ